MEQPTYLRRLKQQWVLLVIGLVVAIAAGLLAGFTILDGQIVPRASMTYTAASNVLLSSAAPTQYQVEIPAETRTVTPEEAAAQSEELIVQQSTQVDLESSAIILAYLAASDQVKDAVADELGGLADDEAISAVRRTTQPGGDENFPGRLELPIISIVGVAASAERAQLISQTATDEFNALVLAEQEELGVSEDIRLVLDELNAPIVGEPEGSNPAIPVVVVAVGVFLLFVAAALVIGAVRDRRGSRRPGASAADDASADDPSGPDPADELLDRDELSDGDAQHGLDEDELRRPARTRQAVRAQRQRVSVEADGDRLAEGAADPAPATDETPVTSHA